MSKKLIIVLALAFVVGITAAAFAEVQNVKISGDVSVIGGIRSNLDFTKNDADSDGWLGITRIKVDANLTDNVDATIRLLNERAWGSGTGHTGTTTSTSEVDVAQAYVTLKEMLNDTVGFPWTVVLGKQSVVIGSGLLIGAAGTNQGNSTQLPSTFADFSKRSSFDAIVNVLDFSPVVVTAGFVKAAEGALTEGGDTNVYVVDAKFNLGEEFKNAVLEGTYALSQKEKRGVQALDGRLVVSPIENVGLEAEYAYQTLKTDPVYGAINTVTSEYIDEARKSKNADAIRFAASLGLPDVAWGPTIGVDYHRFSRYFNPMHENLTPADLANLLFANNNVQCVGVSISAKPMDALMLKLRYADFTFAKRFADSSTYTNSVTSETYALRDGKKDVGSEIDLSLVYDYTSDVQFGVNYGVFNPGKAFVEEKNASQVVGSMKVSF
ncbi:MAG: alginate export family protein [Candidatus Omnitrophica bacterium]|nr:alginate export family protein [Candidatus Omnitrophota bacterium]